MLFAADFDVDVPNAPLKSLLVSMKEDIQLVSLDRAAPVEDFNGFVIVVAFNYHFRAEGVSFVGRHKSIAGLDFMAAGSDTV